MSGFTAYRTYLAVSRHFKTPSFDFFKYHGKVNVRESSYEARKDKYFFEKASRKFKRDEFVKFLIANYSESTDHWIGDLMNARSEITMKKWKKRVESFTYGFKEEICYLSDEVDKFDSLFSIDYGKHPMLYRMHLRKKVSLETMVVLDDLIGYTKYWGKKDDMMLNEVCYKISKYRPFLHMYVSTPKEKFKKIILDEFNG